MENGLATTFESTPQARLGKSFGLTEAVLGVVAGFVLSTIAVSVVASYQHHDATNSDFSANIASLLGLWIGFVGAAVVGSRHHARRDGVVFSRNRFVADYGVQLKPWPDLGLGIAVGIASQYLLIWLLELPLLPFVPHLYSRLQDRAQNLTAGVHGPQLVILGIFICLGSPMVEELFFRGVILRGLLGKCQGLRPTTGWVIPVIGTGIIFGLLHFEALQLLGLMGFGVVLSILAAKTGRLGPGLVAHIAFNSATFIALTVQH